MIRLLIADDQISVVENIKRIVSKQPDIKIISVAYNGKEAYEKSVELLPDIVLLDIDMPELSGIQAAQLIKKSNSSKTRIAFYTSMNDGEYIIQAIKSGIDGYILKETFGDELIYLLRSIHKGICVLSNNARRALAEELIKYDYNFSNSYNKVLSDEELHTLLLICSGKLDREIVSELNRDISEIKKIIENIIYKTGVKNRNELVVWALKNKII